MDKYVLIVAGERASYGWRSAEAVYSYAETSFDAYVRGFSSLGCFRTYNPCASGGSSAVLEYALQGNRLQGPACDRERGRYSLLLG